MKVSTITMLKTIKAKRDNSVNILLLYICLKPELSLVFFLILIRVFLVSFGNNVKSEKIDQRRF